MNYVTEKNLLNVKLKTIFIAGKCLFNTKRTPYYYSHLIHCKYQRMLLCLKINHVFHHYTFM